jgi:hypothetical protein
VQNLSRPTLPLQIHIGAPAWMEIDALACSNVAVFDRLNDLRESGDDAAADRFVDQQRRAGKCTDIPLGTKVFIENRVGGWFGQTPYACARPEGMTTCLYAPESLMRPTLEPQRLDHARRHERSKQKKQACCRQRPVLTRVRECRTEAAGLTASLEHTKRDR